MSVRLNDRDYGDLEKLDLLDARGDDTGKTAARNQSLEVKAATVDNYQGERSTRGERGVAECDQCHLHTLHAFLSEIRFWLQPPQNMRCLGHFTSARIA
jgi:hypothetical protein